MSHRILGIDPALGTTGYGVIEVDGNTVRLVDAGIVRTRTTTTLENRLVEIYDGLCELIDDLNPGCMAIEELYSHYDRPTTAILMGHARGAIFLAAAKRKLEVFPYPATKVKKTLTGNGHAPKAQMQMAIKLQLGLSKFPEPADVADALAIALTHHHSRAASAILDP
ncbi:MAG: crossover junction endodeoxyribonuclease RuvC [Pirellulales bacterium]